MPMTREELTKQQAITRSYLARAGIVLTPDEEQNIEIADMGLGEYETTGLSLVVYFNDERYCAKELVLLPHQTRIRRAHSTSIHPFRS
jgi:D-lyxose ketol-isomerase